MRPATLGGCGALSGDGRLVYTAPSVPPGQGEGHLAIGTPHFALRSALNAATTPICAPSRAPVKYPRPDTETSWYGVMSLCDGSVRLLDETINLRVSQ